MPGVKATVESPPMSGETPSHKLRDAIETLSAKVDIMSQSLQSVIDTLTADMAAQLAALRQAADAVVPWNPPMLTFKSLVGASLACNPGPHVTDLGITDGSTGDVFQTAVI